MVKYDKMLNDNKNTVLLQRKPREATISLVHIMIIIYNDIEICYGTLNPKLRGAVGYNTKLSKTTNSHKITCSVESVSFKFG